MTGGPVSATMISTLAKRATSFLLPASRVARGLASGGRARARSLSWPRLQRLQVIDDRLNPFADAVLVRALAAAKRVTPHRHVRSAVSGHPLAAVDDLVHLLGGEDALLACGDRGEVRWLANHRSRQ